MIQNEKEYEVTKRAVAGFERTLKQLREQLAEWEKHRGA